MAQSQLDLAIAGLVRDLNLKFQPPEFIPGCVVKDVTDINEYATENGWIECLCGRHNQQRVRYKGFPAGVEVDDELDVVYYPSHKFFEVHGVGGATATSADKTKVTKIYESDLGGVALSAAANGDLTAVGSVYIPSDLAHVGDLDTRLLFSGNQIELDIGGVTMLRLTNTTQNNVAFGDTSGVDDVDISINDGQVFLEGSSGNLVIGSTTVLGALLQLSAATPSLYWQETDAAADNKIWQMNPTGEAFKALVVNDAVSASTVWLQVERTGTTVDAVSFPSSDTSIKTTDVTYTFSGASTGVSILVDDDDAANRRTLVMRRQSDSAGRGSQSAFLRARAGPAAVQNGDIVGYFNFEAHDGTDYEIGAQFRATIDNTVAGNQVPMSFDILTSTTNGAGLTSRLHITSAGDVGIGTAGAPATSALLELSSTTGALLLPRMTTTQRNALTPTNGMIIYNTTNGVIEGYESGAWVNL